MVRQGGLTYDRLFFLSCFPEPAYKHLRICETIQLSDEKTNNPLALLIMAVLSLTFINK